jgi:Ca2+-transporting ATPase
MESLQKTQWTLLSPKEALSQTQTPSDTQGLSEDEASLRQEKYGKNALVQKKRKSLFLIFLDEINQPLIYILLGAGFITAFLGEWVDSAVIFGVVLANATIGFLQEIKALNSIEALSKMMNQEATVIRGGKKQRIESSNLTIGDIVLLQSGDRVPADLRIIKSKELQVDESSLTGESISTTKQIEALSEEAILAEQSNMAFSSTLVTYGIATGLVTAIGNETQIGKINQMIASADVLDTPLTKQIAAFSNWMLYIILGFAGVTFVIGLLRGESTLNMFMAAVALAVGAIPEGLPAAMTIILAIGVSKMAKRNAVIRKLPAVETLGSTSVICSDKTGTLTQNQMTVQHILVGKNHIEVSGTGYAPEGDFSQEQSIIQVNENIALQKCLLAGLLCNDARLFLKEDTWQIEGDPTEAALLTVAQKADLDATALHTQLPRIDIIPFESQYQYMATLHQDEEKQENIAFVKGSVEQILERCQRVLMPEGDEKDIEQDFYTQQANQMASEGLRVLAFAYATFPIGYKDISHDDITQNLTFLGLQAMIDPPRPGAIEAIRACQEAGVAVKMITGDHELTALAIAEKLNIISTEQLKNDSKVLNGKQISKLSDEALRQCIDEVCVFARVSPEDKLRLVKALQKEDAIIAMTGDGVNDAPSLQQANIGISMGITGTDVAKETADMILVDDNFSSITAAIEEGRGVYDNLIKFITWTLPTNFGQGLIIMLAVILGTKLPILPVQILWINMTTAVLLGLMLAFEPKEPDIMQRSPRSPQASILSIWLIMRITFVGVLLCIGAFVFFEFALIQGESQEIARTKAVNIFVVGEIFFLFNCRSLNHTMFKIGVFSNSAVLLGVSATIILQLIYTYAPFMHLAFQSASLSASDWIPILSIGLSIYLLVELEKYLTYKYLQKRGKNIIG